MLRLAAVEERIEAELALGRHTALCAELELLVEEHPLHERLRGQLMLALYRSGRQADALETYRAGRSLLVEELAVEPGPQLRQLQLAILEQDAALELPQLTSHDGPAPVLALAEESPSGEPDSDVTLRVRRRGRARWAVLALGVCAVLAVFAIAPLGSYAHRHEPLNGNLLALISPSDGALRATVSLQAPPTDLAAGFGSLWVAEADAGLVVRVDLRRRESSRRSRSVPGPAASSPPAGRSGFWTRSTAPSPGSIPKPTRWRRRSPWGASPAMF